MAVTGLDQATQLRLRSLKLAGLLGLIFSVGTAGYMVFEGWSVLDALYMTVITLFTVGFSEVHPLSDVGRVFTIGLIVSGVGAAAYLFTSIAEYVVGGQLTGILWSRRMQQRIDRLSGHHIICGFGRVGQEVAHELELR